MAEYINREKAKVYLIGDYAYAAAKVIDEVPSADVVEVVRCKDCKYFKPNAIIGVIECGTCIRVSSFEPLELTNRIESDFCSYGERRSI
jgi:hypothetical protein